MSFAGKSFQTKLGISLSQKWSSYATPSRHWTFIYLISTLDLSFTTPESFWDDALIIPIWKLFFYLCWSAVSWSLNDLNFFLAIDPEIRPGYQCTDDHGYIMHIPYISYVYHTYKTYVKHIEGIASQILRLGLNTSALMIIWQTAFNPSPGQTRWGKFWVSPSVL